MRTIYAVRRRSSMPGFGVYTPNLRFSEHVRSTASRGELYWEGVRVGVIFGSSHGTGSTGSILRVASRLWVLLGISSALTLGIRRKLAIRAEHVDSMPGAPLTVKNRVTACVAHVRTISGAEKSRELQREIREKSTRANAHLESAPIVFVPPCAKHERVPRVHLQPIVSNVSYETPRLQAPYHPSLINISLPRRRDSTIYGTEE